MKAYLCSFCGKRPYEMLGSWVQGDNAVICHDCIERLHVALGESSLGEKL